MPQETINTPDDDLAQLWEQGKKYLDPDASIERAVSSTVQGARGLSQDSMDEIAESWAENANTHLATARYMLSLSHDDADNMEEWRGEALRALVSYYIFKGVVDALYSTSEPALTPPTHIPGETAQEYAKRLQDYAEQLCRTADSVPYRNDKNNDD